MQPRLIPKTNKERITELTAALKIYGKHSLFCCWRDGRYQKNLRCTCGLSKRLEMKMTVQQDDVIQITDENHHWFPCLLVVDEVKNWGVTASIYIPQDNLGNVVEAPTRLENGSFERIGCASVAIR